MKMRLAASAFAVSLGMAAAFGPTPVAHAAVVYYLYTGQTNAQTQVDATHSSVWQFSATADFLFGGGHFTMKRGPSTSAGITLTVYDVTNLMAEVAQVDFSVGDFNTAHGGNPQNYDDVFFNPFTTPNGATDVLLLANHVYQAELTSTAADQQNQAYFIKGSDSAAVLDGPPPGGQPPPGGETNIVPEPTSVALFGVGLALLSGARQRRRMKT